MLNDSLSNALSVILNSEKIARSGCSIKPISKVVKKVLSIMKDNKYVGDFKEVEDNRGNFIKINLIGNINKCGSIKPRFAIKNDSFEKYEKRYLPAKDMGIILISTSKGIMTNAEAKKKGLGGKLIAYCY